MFWEYDNGYFKALLDILEFVNSHSEIINHDYRGNKKYTLLINLIKYLAKNPEKRELFKKYGGYVELIVNDIEIIDLKERKN